MWSFQTNSITFSRHLFSFVLDKTSPPPHPQRKRFHITVLPRKLTLIVHHAFWYIILSTSTTLLRRKTRTHDDKFSFLCFNLDTILKNSTSENSPKFEKLNDAKEPRLSFKKSEAFLVFWGERVVFFTAVVVSILNTQQDLNSVTCKCGAL